MEWSQKPRFVEYLLDHGRESLEYIHMSPPLNLAYQAMFKCLRHIDIRMCNLVESVQTTHLFSDINKQRLFAQRGNNSNVPSSIATPWINLASTLPPSVETIKLTDTNYPLLYNEAIGLAKMLEKVIKAKDARLSKLRGLCVVDVISQFAHPEWASRRARQLSQTAPVKETFNTQKPYGSDAERRHAGIHCFCAGLRRLAARHGVEIHTNPVEGCVGPGSTLFCHLREPYT